MSVSQDLSNYASNLVRSCMDSDELEWLWDASDLSTESCTYDSGAGVILHCHKSAHGTEVVKGTKLLTSGIHYWEVEVLSALFGTDTLIGVGVKDLDVKADRYRFVSFLGQDFRSYGHSYRKGIQSRGTFSRVRCRDFNTGSKVGCLLDMVHKKLQFYVDRFPSGYTLSLRGDAFYPMISSTSVISKFRLVYAKSFDMALKNLIIYKRILPLNKTELPPLLKSLLDDTWPLRLPRLDRPSQSRW